jgi:AraC family transcriptional regulator, alkane utilization regulator
MRLDVLTQLSESIPFDRAVAILSELRAPWGISIPGNRLTAFHATLEGSWVLDAPPAAPIAMRAGDIALLPVDRPHHGRDCATTGLVPLTAVCDIQSYGPPAKFRYGGHGAQTRILTATIPVDVPQRTPVLDALPPLVLLRGDGENPNRAIAPLVHRLAAEAELRRPGYMTVSRRLIEVLFIEMLRSQVDNDEIDAGLLSALGDRRISAALAAIHREVNHRWTVSELARLAGMSRSLFATRFAVLVGATPHQYLVRARIQCAAQLLRSQELTVHEVSARVGYTSESSFSRVFTREIGVPPATYRRRQDEELQTKAGERGARAKPLGSRPGGRWLSPAIEASEVRAAGKRARAR